MKHYERSVPLDALAGSIDELIDGLARDERPTVITIDGKPKAVLQDIGRYKELQEALTLLKGLATGERLEGSSPLEPES